LSVIGAAAGEGDSSAAGSEMASSGVERTSRARRESGIIGLEA